MTSDHPVKCRKKLIEVAIPLEAINAASAREKSIRHGHPSTLHLWWARRPLAAARAVIFCQMVDDPSAVPEDFPTEEDQEKERLRLFALISELVLWESTTNEEVLERAREEIRRSWRRCCADNADHPEAAELFNPDKLPGFHDPFAGGGALPLEAQRLGLESYASDLNPVAVLINKAMIEVPPKYVGMPPINPEALSQKSLTKRRWPGLEGLAEDVRYYGKRVRDEAEALLGHLYPKIAITREMVNTHPELEPYQGQELTVIAWIWAKTVKSPNPAFAHVDVPLTSTFMLSTKPGKEAFVKPVIEADSYRFEAWNRKPEDAKQAKSGTKLGRANFKCIVSGEPITPSYIKNQAAHGQLGSKLMAIAAEGSRGRVFLSPSIEHENAAECPRPEGIRKTKISGSTQYLGVKPYGIEEFDQLFTNRQLASLDMFSRVIEDIGQEIEADRLAADTSLSDEYASAISIFLLFGLGKSADYWSSCCIWRSDPKNLGVGHVFARQAIPMTWDYAEANPFSSSSGNFNVSIDWIARAIRMLPGSPAGLAEQADAQNPVALKSNSRVISTDPPYYDNVPYADLSDFFYFWLRSSAQKIYPMLFATVATPKAEELVAFAYRHDNNKPRADHFFLEGMTKAMMSISREMHKGFPSTIYYAFKQSETKDAETTSTGWESFINAILRAGMQILGTWPISTEMGNRTRGIDSNALATSVVLVCKNRDHDAHSISRQIFRRRLREDLPASLKLLEGANIAPVDIAQAAIGPGIAIFSSANAVLNPDDSPMSVREALIEINSALDEYLSQDEGDLDADSRFALTFFESYGYAERDFGDAENLAKARNVSVAGVAEAGILHSVAGKVRLLQRAELEEDWDPAQDKRLCIWEATQQLIFRLEADGEGGAASLLSKLKQITGHGDLASNCRALAYRLYNHCEKTKQAEEARAYNGLVIAWPELEKLSALAASPVQPSLL